MRLAVSESVMHQADAVCNIHPEQVWIRHGSRSLALRNVILPQHYDISCLTRMLRSVMANNSKPRYSPSVGFSAARLSQLGLLKVPTWLSNQSDEAMLPGSSRSNCGIVLRFCEQSYSERVAVHI